MEKKDYTLYSNKKLEEEILLLEKQHEQLKESVRGTQYKTIIKYRFKYLKFLNDLI